MSIYVDLHVLQTVPPSCINRDDTGSPKTALYGGTRRSRVSSQAWKSAMRKEFKLLFEKKDLGYRTKHVVDILSESLNDAGVSDKAVQDMAKKALEYAGLKLSSKKEGDVDALFFLSYGQAKALATLITAGEKDKKKYKEALKNNPSVDIALFGRMVAADPLLNYDATAQVAHAISTHTIQNEYDYFAAVDDCAEDDNAGAGHLGTIEYNSSTLYRYATINVSELQKSTEKMTAYVIRNFVEAFVRSMPTGKQNTFANRTMPDMVYITIRNDQPINLSGAFERAVFSRMDGYVSTSKEAFATYTEKLYNDYDMKPIAEYAVGVENMLGARKLSFSELLSTLEEDIRIKVE